MGLGSSSALLVAFFEAMAVQAGEKLAPEKIIELCGRVERERLNRQIGDADPAVCVYGGWRRYEYRPTVSGKTVVSHERVKVAKNIPASFRYYRTHLPRASENDLLSLGKTTQSQQNLWRHMADLTNNMIKAAKLGDTERLGQLLNESWHTKCKLSGVIDTRVRTMCEIAKRAGASGVKSSGAGNSNLLVCAKPEKFPDISAALAKVNVNEIVDINGKPIGFGGDGSRVDARIPF